MKNKAQHVHIPWDILLVIQLNSCLLCFFFTTNAALKVQLGKPERNYQRATLLVFDNISTEYKIASSKRKLGCASATHLF